MKKDNRVRINKRMVAWSDGREIHLPPTVQSEANQAAGQKPRMRTPVEEGYEPNFCGASEYYDALDYEALADRELECGRVLYALRYLLYAAAISIEVDDDYRECLDPILNPPSQRNMAFFLRIIERCKELCRQHPRLRSVMEQSVTWSDYCYMRRVYGEYGYRL